MLLYVWEKATLGAFSSCGQVIFQDLRGAGCQDPEGAATVWTGWESRNMEEMGQEGQ